MAIAPAVTHDTYQQESHTAAVEQASRQQTTAVVLATSVGGEAGTAATSAAIFAAVVWKAPDGSRRTGSVRVDRGMAGGVPLPVWTDQTGQLVDAPGTYRGAMTWAVLAGFRTVLIGFSVFAALWWLAHWQLDRIRLAAWERDWARTFAP